MYQLRVCSRTGSVKEHFFAIFLIRARAGSLPLCWLFLVPMGGSSMAYGIALIGEFHFAP